MNEPKLKPCPCCSGEAEVVEGLTIDMSVCWVCCKCGLKIFSVDKTMDEAKRGVVYKWNRRSLETKWIPVTERLPKDGEPVLVWEVPKTKCFSEACTIKCFAKDGSRVDSYDSSTRGKKNIFYDYDSEYGYLVFDDVTHWMSLPEPPRKVMNK